MAKMALRIACRAQLLQIAGENIALHVKKIEYILAPKKMRRDIPMFFPENSYFAFILPYFCIGFYI